jgi:2-polyprenyl-3-methyl-5-hydroxy-6-metoxy-1,4-benzoquinol methylase
MQLAIHKRKHRQIIPPEDRLDESFSNCPLCHSDQTRRIGSIHVVPEINVMACLNCHVGYIDRQPSESFLREFYTGYYGKDNRHTTIDPELLARHLFRHFGPLQEKSTRSILDFGGGDGSASEVIAARLLKLKIASKVNLCVVDYNAEAKVLSTPVQRTSYQTLESIPRTDKYDMVIASAILEHVKDPGTVITGLLMKLEPGGVFYARTPYMYPIYSGLKKVGIKMDLPYPAHLFDMGSRFWNSLLKTLDLTADFELIRSRTSLVESSLRRNPLRTAIAFIMKIPSYILPHSYPFVGGWEVFIRRKNDG